MWLMTSNASLTSSTQVDWCLKNLKIPGVFTPGVFFEGHSLVAKFQPDVRSCVSPAYWPCQHYEEPGNASESRQEAQESAGIYQPVTQQPLQMPRVLLRC